MPNWCSFGVSVKGPQEDREAVTAILNGLPVEHDFIVDAREFLKGDPDATGNQTYWERGSIKNVDNTLHFSGTMCWAPPLCLLERLSQMFPSLVFDCRSTIEDERRELWRFQDGEGELIEEMLVSLQTDETLFHYLKEGEASVFDGSVELQVMEDAANAIVNKCASPAWTEKAIQRFWSEDKDATPNNADIEASKEDGENE